MAALGLVARRPGVPGGGHEADPVGRHVHQDVLGQRVLQSYVRIGAGAERLAETATVGHDLWHRPLDERTVEGGIEPVHQGTVRVVDDIHVAQPGRHGRHHFGVKGNSQ